MFQKIIIKLFMKYILKRRDETFVVMKYREKKYMMYITQAWHMWEARENMEKLGDTCMYDERWIGAYVDLIRRQR